MNTAFCAFALAPPGTFFGYCPHKSFSAPAECKKINKLRLLADGTKFYVVAFLHSGHCFLVLTLIIELSKYSSAQSTPVVRRLKSLAMTAAGGGSK